ncbi:hypothetical protein LTS72_07585 [Mycobacterium ostraviense]|uniref:Uncharacterized protein n=1 Tax=Mycobacterium ostraviense TaxID=2738409 RepID=A0A164EM54_9MYCO|nr:hypothetical protein [Mycobacterium ostraviense]KZS67700.1 hypothetical protein A4G28_03280 [Mycobacterium ostraviense]UGT93160.1 hypothetical protein LTS72_07585 [Mycobacterium ostraviense]
MVACVVDCGVDAAQAVGAGTAVESYQLLDQLGLLVDKSLVVADDTGYGMRYCYWIPCGSALDKLDESGETDDVRTRHRDYYTGMATELQAQGHWADERLLHWAQTEIDNLRAAFTWSRESGDLDTALQLILSSRPLWLRGGRVEAALAGLSAILADEDHSAIAPAVWAGAVAQYCILASWVGKPAELGRAQEALAVARDLGDPALIARA